jgi:hypothetical protein
VVIGLLETPRCDERNRVLSRVCLRACVWGSLAVLLTGGLAWGQRQPRLQNQPIDPYRQGRFGGQPFGGPPLEEEEPVKKPNLAERNNITPKPLMTPEEEASFKNLLRQREYTDALRSQNPRGAEEKIINDGVKSRVYRLTLPENWSNLANLRRDLVNDIDELAGDDHARTRRIALDAAVKYLTELLADQPYVVKLNAALLLGQLNEKSGSAVDRVAAKPYVPAAEPLIQVVHSSDQPTAVKVAAVVGLRRIFEDGSPPRSLRDQAAKVFIEELHEMEGTELTDGQEWYYWRIVDALGVFQETRTAIQEELVVDALWETMLNANLPPHIRTNAARSLSQLDFDSSFNMGLIAHEIVRLCGTMTAQFNQQPQLPYWRRCFLDLYFAFNPHQEEEAARGWGLRQQANEATLREHKPMVDGAYDHVLKMVNEAIKNEPPQKVPLQTLQEADAWMKANPPTDQKLHANAQTVEAIQNSFVPPAEKKTTVSHQSAPPEEDLSHQSSSPPENE